MTDRTFAAEVGSDVVALRPDFVGLSVLARGIRNAPTDPGITERLQRACDDLRWAAWADAHLEAWRDAYRSFGAKPQRTPASAEALRRRAERDGGLASINAVVDLYNAVSIRFAIPVGGENVAAYEGAPRLVRAAGGEPFDTVKDGLPWLEPVDAGEVVWRDDRGVTCRRWNWRQGTRTRLDVESRDMWFILERLDPMPIAALDEAGAELVRGLLDLTPEAEITTTLIGCDATNS